MYCVIKCYMRGNQARVKNADLRHPSCTVVMYRRKSASLVLNVLTKTKILFSPTLINKTAIHITKKDFEIKVYTAVLTFKSSGMLRCVN